MKIIGFKNLSVKQLRSFEEEIGFKLPKDYIEFLIEYNGGTFGEKDGYIYVPSINEYVLFDVFYRVLSEDSTLDDDELSLQCWYNEYKEDLPSNTIIIACDAGGGMFILSMDDNNQGVYYWDHSHFFPSSSDEGNSYRVAKNFDDFLGKIKDNYEE